MSTKFKIGDKVIRTINEDRFASMFIGSTYTINKINTDGWLEFKENSHGCWNPSNFELVQSKQFTKSDLKDGMRVVYRDGRVRYVLGNTTLSYEPSAYTGGGKYCHASYTDDYDNNLKKEELFKSMDIMKVIDRDNTVLFERVEAPAKSQQEIEMDKLQKQIAELSAQADKLKASMKQPFKQSHRAYMMIYQSRYTLVGLDGIMAQNLITGIPK